MVGAGAEVGGGERELTVGGVVFTDAWIERESRGEDWWMSVSAAFCYPS